MNRQKREASPSAGRPRRPITHRPARHAIAGRTLGALAALALATACIASPGPNPALACGGRGCLVSVQNDAGNDIAVRYADSTGRHDDLGLVVSHAVRGFRLQWVRSRAVRIFAQSVPDRQTYYADVQVDPTSTMEVHFPDDFQPTPDLDSLVTHPRKP